MYCRLWIAFVIAGCRCSVVKKRFHRRFSSMWKSWVWSCGSSVLVSCAWMCGWCVICCSSGCVVCTALCRLSSMELSIQSWSGGVRCVSSSLGLTFGLCRACCSSCMLLW